MPLVLTMARQFRSPETSPPSHVPSSEAGAVEIPKHISQIQQTITKSANRGCVAPYIVAYIGLYVRIQRRQRNPIGHWGSVGFADPLEEIAHIVCGMIGAAGAAARELLSKPIPKRLIEAQVHVIRAGSRIGDATVCGMCQTSSGTAPFAS